MNFSESHDWLKAEEAKHRKQALDLEASFYSSRARVGITGFIFDCFAGKQDHEFDLESAPIADCVDVKPSFMEEPITYALVSSAQLLFSAVDSLATGISNLFLWKQAESSKPPVVQHKTPDLFEVVIEGEIERTMQNIQRQSSNQNMNRSFAPVAVKLEDKEIPILDNVTVQIESPKMSNIFETNYCSCDNVNQKRMAQSVSIADVNTQEQLDSEYVDTENYWYKDNEAEDDEGEEQNYKSLSSSFYAMKSYIDSSEDAKIVAKPIPKKNPKNPKVKVRFEPMVELMDSVVNNDKAAIKKVLQEGQINVNDRDKLGYSMLHYAASHEHIDLIKYLVEKGADVNSLDLTGWTPLHLAAIADHHKACKTLLDFGANFEYPNDDEALPIDLTEDDKVKKLLAEATKKKLASKKVKAIYDWSSTSPEYLNMKKSESLKVLERRQDLWLVQNDSKQIGLVPRYFVQ